jgi:hypothetical protein
VIPVADLVDKRLAQRSCEQLQIQVKGIQSILRMLDGNTLPSDIETLERVWLFPIQEQIVQLGLFPL